MADEGFWRRLINAIRPGHDEPQEPAPPSSPPPKPEPRTTPEADDLHAAEPPAATKQQPGEPRVSGSSMNNFKTDSVTAVYAQALFELAESAGTLDAIADEMDQLADLLAGNRDLVAMLSSKALSREDRTGVIDRVFKGTSGGRVSDVVYRFLHVLNRKDRLGALPGVTTSFASLVAEKRGIVEVDVFVAQKLDEASVKQVAESIGKALGGKQAVIHQYVDESLIGGLKIRVGDQLIDGSVATQLTRMKRGLIEAGREKARQMASND